MVLLRPVFPMFRRDRIRHPHEPAASILEISLSYCTTRRNNAVRILDDRFVSSDDGYECLRFIDNMGHERQKSQAPDEVEGFHFYDTNFA